MFNYSIQHFFQFVKGINYFFFVFYAIKTALFNLLFLHISTKSVRHVGEIKYKDAICKGEQEAIVPRDLWDRVKEIQRSIDPQSDHSRRQETIAPLKSILRCGHCGGAMMLIDLTFPGNHPCNHRRDFRKGYRHRAAQAGNALDVG